MLKVVDIKICVKFKINRNDESRKFWIFGYLIAHDVVIKGKIIHG